MKIRSTFARANRIRPLRVARSVTLEQLAELTGISATHLSRMQTGERTLSVDAAEKIAAALGVSSAEVLGLEMAAAAAAPASFGEDELVPYTPAPSDPFTKPTGVHRQLMTVTSNVLENLGLRSGDQVEIDGSHEACKNPKPLAAVRAQWHPYPDQPGRAYTLLRQFVPPSKLISNSTRADAPVLDLERDDVQILGVITWSHRRIGS